jgi:hypothetical protein
MLQILGQVLNVGIETEHLSMRWGRRVKEIEEFIQQNEDLVEVLDSLKKGQKRKPFLRDSSKVVRLDEFMRRRDESPLNRE